MVCSGWGVLGLRLKTVRLSNVCCSWNVPQPLRSSFFDRGQVSFKDLDDSVDEELGDLIQQVAPGSVISTYLETDKERPACYSFLNDQQLLDTIGTTADVVEIESDDESDMEDVVSTLKECSNETSALMSFNDVQEIVQSISVFFIKKGNFNVLVNLAFLAKSKRNCMSEEV